MKKLFFSLFISLFLNLGNCAPPPEWGFLNFREGMTVSKTENKPIFILFGFQKCPACNMLYSRAFSDKKLRDFYKNNFVLIYVSIFGENEEENYVINDQSMLTNKQLINHFKIETVPAWHWMTNSGIILGSDKGGDTTVREFYFKAENNLKKFNKIKLGS
jgi:thioredoxin-related protein